MSDNEDYMKDEFEKEVEQVHLKMNLSLKGFLPLILPALLVAVYSLFILTKIPEAGLSAKYLFKINILTPMAVILLGTLLFVFNKLSLGRKNILGVFSLGLFGVVGFLFFQSEKIVISYSAFQMALLPIAGVSLAVILYYIIYAKTAVIIANKRFVQLSYGVFTRVSDSTNLTKIQDEDMHRNTMDLILGLGKIICDIGRNQKVIYEKITIQDAERLHRFIKANAFGQSREYWLTKDRINNRVKSNNNRTDSLRHYIAEGEDFGGDDSDESDGQDESN